MSIARRQHNRFAVLCLFIGVAAGLGAVEIAAPQPSAMMVAPTSPDEMKLTIPPMKPGDSAELPTGCWGPCKESSYLALKAADPKITREAVSKMSGQGPDAPDPELDKRIKHLDLSNPRWAVSPATLKDLLGMMTKPRLIDARTPSDDDGRSIVGAFPLRLPLATETLLAVLPDKNEMVVVFGNDEKTLEVEQVATELRRQGYGNVLELREGLAGWVAKNGETISTRIQETTDTPVASTP